MAFKRHARFTPTSISANGFKIIDLTKNKIFKLDKVETLKGV